MVVNGLDEYITVKCQQCVKTVPICSKPGTSYVIDGCSFVKNIIKQTSWVFGGQWKEIKDSVERFVISVLGEGCDAIFVMPHWPDALTPTDLQNIKMGLEFVSINKQLPSLDFYQHPPCAYFFVSQVLKACRVEVICTVNDFEFEVAAWAKLRKCTGVISDNNEFVALNGVPYFKLSSLDTNNHTIDTVDRFLLMKNLGLKLDHVPLLSCLMGNSLVPPEMLKVFHKKLQSGMQLSGRNIILDIMPRLCMYARPQTIQFNMLARTALSDESKKGFLEVIMGRYKMSSVTEDWKPNEPVDESLVTYNSLQIHEDAVRRQVSCDSIPIISGVLTNLSYEQGVTLQDKPLSSAFELYRPLRKLCYSIILGSGGSVSEKCISDACEVKLIECQEFRVNEKVVKLEDLAESQTLRWAAFVRCANVTFNENLARELPTQFLGLCSILNYWWHSPLIHLAQWELNAFLAQAVSQYAGDVSSLRRVLVTVVNSRAITLAALLARGAESLLQIAAVTSLSQDAFLPNNYFDGKLFSFYYYLSDKGAPLEKLCDDIPERIEMFKFLMMVIQSDSLVIEDNIEEKEKNGEAKNEEKKEEGNVSIVPEYEEISDEEENNFKTEPVSDDELFDEAFSKDSSKIMTLSKLEENIAVSTKSANKSTVDKRNGDDSTIDKNVSRESEILLLAQQAMPLVRNDSTSSTVQELMQLQMISPGSETRPRFPSFPNITEKPAICMSKNSSSTEDSSSMKCLFPINGDGDSEEENHDTFEHSKTKPLLSGSNDSFVDNNIYVQSSQANGIKLSKNNEPLPPGFENLHKPKNDEIYEPAEPNFDARLTIPLPPLPVPLIPQLLTSTFPELHKVSDNEISIHPHPTPTYKRYSDQENSEYHIRGRGIDSSKRDNVGTNGYPIYSIVSSQDTFRPPGPCHPIKRHRSDEGS